MKNRHPQKMDNVFKCVCFLVHLHPQMVPMFSVIIGVFLYGFFLKAKSFMDFVFVSDPLRSKGFDPGLQEGASVFLLGG